MRITADTNLLVRAVIMDNAAQAEAARRVLASAELVAIPIAVFCELAWVLGAGYRYTREQIAVAIGQCLQAGELETEFEAVEAGLDCLALGGDFADGAIACQGRALGGAAFASFDAKARRALARQGYMTLDPLA